LVNPNNFAAINSVIFVLWQVYHTSNGMPTFVGVRSPQLTHNCGNPNNWSRWRSTRNLIREDKIPQIYSAMQTGTEQGMMTLEQHLKELVHKGQITLETARGC
jgi:hypothetical protein